MKTPESYIGEAMFPNQKTGRDFLVKFFITGNGYQYHCRVCEKTAIYRMEIYSHIFEPQGSEYYCEGCAPGIPLSEKD